jgi:phosphoribosylformimino-5-aminoimidazole carboxamide ribotide isomerase
MAIQIVPSIDLRGGRVVRLKQGDYGRQVTYDVDPFATARSFADAGA